mgnify:CR=1 FL=1
MENTKTKKEQQILAKIKSKLKKFKAPGTRKKQN